MDFYKFVNELNWKKLILIVLGCYFAFWVVREIIFIEFIRAFKNTYSQFSTQFDQDQQRIHNIIQDNFKRQQAMQKEMDEKTKDFHNYVDHSMNQILGYLNKDYVSSNQHETNQEATRNVSEAKKEGNDKQ